MYKKYFYMLALALASTSCGLFSAQVRSLSDGDRKRVVSRDSNTAFASWCNEPDQTNSELQFVSQQLAEVEQELVWCAAESPAEKDFRKKKDGLVSQKFQLLETRMSQMEGDQQLMAEVIGNFGKELENSSPEGLAEIREFRKNKEKVLTELPNTVERIVEGALSHAGEYVKNVTAFHVRQQAKLLSIEKEVENLRKTVSTLTAVFLNNRTRVQILGQQCNGIEYGVMSWKDAHEEARNKDFGLVCNGFNKDVLLLRKVKAKKNDNKRASRVSFSEADQKAGQASKEDVKYMVYGVHGGSLGKMPLRQIEVHAQSENARIELENNNVCRLVKRADERQGSTVGLVVKSAPSSDKTAPAAVSNGTHPIQESAEEESAISPRDDGKANPVPHPHKPIPAATPNGDSHYEAIEDSEPEETNDGEADDNDGLAHNPSATDSDGSESEEEGDFARGRDTGTLRSTRSSNGADLSVTPHDLDIMWPLAAVNYQVEQSADK